MQKYSITGMHCAACQARVEKAVSGVDGVESAAVSLLTNSLGVQGSADPENIIKAVRDAGYGARLFDPGADGQSDAEASAALREAQEEALKDHESPKLKKRLMMSLGFLILLMYISMVHMMLDLPLPGFLEGNPMGMAIAQMILSAVIMIINREFFTNGFGSLFRLAPNMDSLVAMGSMTSFLWSVFVFSRIVSQQASDPAKAMELIHELYFESAAMIVTLITVGKLLEAMSKGKTTNALKSLLRLSPKTALVERAEGLLELPIGDVRRGDIFVVKAGDVIPVDGEIIEGMTAVDESALTGESIPVDKEAGDPLSAGTTNVSGYVRAKATRVGEDTTLAQIIKMVGDASASKAPIARIADRVSAVFVPVVISIAALVILIWLLKGEGAGYALARGIAVLVISCPCALGLATPVAIMAGSGVGARKGILFKTAEALEIAGRTDIAVLDKTGTITEGMPVVTDIIPADNGELLPYAFGIERGSEHPLGKAIVAFAEETGTEEAALENISTLPGRGIEGREMGSGMRITGGSQKYIETIAHLPGELSEAGERLASEGKTLLFFARGDEVMGLIALADTLKEDSAAAINELKRLGIAVVMLTGDQEKTARVIAREAGIEDVVAGVLPQDKERIVRSLRKQGTVAMVGDGINDAPALTGADLGIAIGAGADVAVDAADVVLMNSRLSDVAAAIRLSRKTMRNIRENLFWAFFYNILLIPLAAGLYSSVMHGWSLNPMLAAAAMSISSFCVCMNALRLNLFDINDSSKTYRKRISGGIMLPVTEDNEQKEMDVMMKRTMKIEGMMCTHCEATVKKALEGLEGVAEATVSHENGIAEVVMDTKLSDETLKKAVEDRDYEVLSID